MMNRSFAALLTAFLLTTSTALADNVVLIEAVGGSPSDADAARNECKSAFEALGHTVNVQSDASCSVDTPSCRESLLSGSDASRLARLAIWPATESRSEGRVILELAPPVGQGISVRETYANDDELPGAIERAVIRSMAEFAAVRERTRVRIEGAPEGASVWVDGQPAGNVPFETQLARGEHRIRVMHQGYQSFSEAVMVGDEPVSLNVELEEGEDEAAQELVRAPGDGESSGSGRSIAGGVLIGAGAATIVGVTVGTLLATSDGGPDGYPRDINVGPFAAYLGVGAALAAVGVVLLVTGGDDGEPSTSLRIGPTGATVSGTF